MAVVAGKQQIGKRSASAAVHSAAVSNREPPAAASVQPKRIPIAERLLAWYDRERRDLPWRYGPGEPANPYRVWLSEIMLQQTTVKAVIPYFETFLKAFPTVRRLAKADLDEVLRLWAGLGYYSRARNLHACAREIVKRHKGKFPSREADLAELPGIGPYTAAAIAAIAFAEKATPVDGNVERVVARLFAITEPLPRSKPALKARAVEITPDARAGDFAQAMMDLGATICSPKRPSCLMCPLTGDCSARAQGIEETLPLKLAKGARPTRYATAFMALREDGHILLRKRAPSGLLAGMMEVPTSDWADAPAEFAEAERSAPIGADWWPVPGTVIHVFTHFRLEIQVYHAVVPVEASLNLWAAPDRCRWSRRSQLHGEALPSLMRKIIGHAMRDR